MTNSSEFVGAKVALFLGKNILVLRRDARLDLPWPDCLDWPGGGREKGESPEACALREIREEVGLSLDCADLDHATAINRTGHLIWYFVARLPASAADQVRFGGEGQGYAVMTPQALCRDAACLPYYRTFLAALLTGSAEGLRPEGKIACGTPAPGRSGTTNIPAWKFVTIRQILRELIRSHRAAGLPFQGLAQRVANRMDPADLKDLGSVGWHVTTVKLELEVRGEIVRALGPGAQRLLPGPAFFS